MDTPENDRLTILERAQLLHDAPRRRHGEMLDTHAVALVELRQIQERQESLMETLTALAAQHEERMAKLQQTLDAIKDILDRPHGRPSPSSP